MSAPYYENIPLSYRSQFSGVFIYSSGTRVGSFVNPTLKIWVIDKGIKTATDLTRNKFFDTTRDYTQDYWYLIDQCNQIVNFYHQFVKGDNWEQAVILRSCVVVQNTYAGLSYDIRQSLPIVNKLGLGIWTEQSLQSLIAEWNDLGSPPGKFNAPMTAQMKFRDFNRFRISSL